VYSANVDVRQVALVLLLADREAEVRALVAAVDALAALRREQGHHVVADLERRDARADRLDHAGALVSEDGRRVPGRIDAGGRVEVGVADAARGQPHERFALARLAQLELPDDERLAELLENRGPHLHRRPASCITRAAIVWEPPIGHNLGGRLAQLGEQRAYNA
jgi:hypothetical protein